MISASGCNFHSTDPPEAVELYHKLFNWKIIMNSLNHGELEIISDQQFLLYIDKAHSHCPTYPGTLSIHFKSLEEILNWDSLEKMNIWKENFKLEFRDAKNRYQSWLDPWKNRIWIIF